MMQRIIYRLLFISIVSSFFLGNYVLENIGVPYVSNGGSPIFKIHIYSYIIITCFIFILYSQGVNNILLQLGDMWRCWLLAMTSISTIIFYGMYRFGSSGMAYMVDTFLVPFLFFSLVMFLSRNERDKLVDLILYLFIINCIIAIVEYLAKISLVGAKFSSFSHFRSTALISHPLSNALFTAVISISLFISYRSYLPVLLCISTLSLFAFGGRGSMAAFLIGCLLLYLPFLFRILTGKVKVHRYKFSILLFFSYILVYLLAYILIESGITSRIIEKLYIDNSATARFDVFILLEEMSLLELILGASHDFLDNIFYISGVLVIENYFIDWIVKYGLIFAVFFSLAIYFFMLRASSNYTHYIMILVLWVASITNNSLGTKTPILIYVFTLLAVEYKNKYEESKND
ncbi:VpsF family polysaccharide biosynthesis protein [Vibrio sp. DNB22_19_1]